MPRPFIPVYWDPTAKRILCDLPLTQPTGRARLRREGRPIAARQVPLQADDMFEWQIAYRDEEGNPVELGEMLLCGSVFRRDPCIIEDGGSGLKPLLPKTVFS